MLSMFKNMPTNTFVIHGIYNSNLQAVYYIYNEYIFIKNSDGLSKCLRFLIFINSWTSTSRWVWSSDVEIR